MCGIFAYYAYNTPDVDLKRVLEQLFNGLKRLEYRGYDSAGIALDVIEPVPSPPSCLDAINGGGDPAAAVVTLRQHAATCSSSRERRVSSRAESCSDVIAEENGTHCSPAPLVVKEVGKVSMLEKLTYETVEKEGIELNRLFKNQVAISHTRWATHGPPSAVNSHPHVSGPEAEFTVVHNGIITNYKPLKDLLIKHGMTFVSETDTEVIPKLCKYVYERLTERVPFPKLVMEVLKKLEGAYAVLVKSTLYPGELVACKRGSPMIIGIRQPPPPTLDAPGYVGGGGNHHQRSNSFSRLRDSYDDRWKNEAIECWIASDASAVVEHTKKVVVMEDNDVLHLTGGGYGIYNTQQVDPEEAVRRVLMTLEMEVEQIMKGGYDHYMQKEIHEQPESLLLTLGGRVKFQREAVGNPFLVPRVKLGGLVDHTRIIKNSRRMIFVACGTSFHACLAARQTVEELCDLPVVLELASDLLDRRCPIFRDDACVFVSQSGETADTLVALEYAKAKGALCIGITNTVGSSISRQTHCGMHLNAGYEIGVASTKAYTSMIISIVMMALQLSEDSISKRELRDKIIDELGQLPGKVRNVLMLDQAMRSLAEQLKDEHSLMFFARGRNYATALEAALKAKEVALIHSEGILAGEMKHGPLALVDEKLPVVVVATKDSMYKKMDSVIQQLLARAAHLFIVCNEGDEAMKAYEKQGCQLIQVPGTVDALQPVINIVPLQLLSYHLTILRGHNVDQPRNLAKSVTTSEEQ